MKTLNFVAGLILIGGCLTAQQPANDNSNGGRPTSTPRAADSNRNAQSTTADHGGTLTNDQKVAAYDKWSEKQKMSVAKSMGHDMSKMRTAERSDAMAKMTAQDKADAYDYYSTHNNKKSKTSTTTNP